MKIINTQKELEPIMEEMAASLKNTWHPSRFLKGFYFWNHEQREINTTFPIIYSKLSILKKTAKKLFGWKGYMAKRNLAQRERINTFNHDI